MTKIIFNIWLFFSIFDFLTYTYMDKTCRNFLDSFSKERRISSIHVSKNDGFLKEALFYLGVIFVSIIPVVHIILGLCWFFWVNSIMAKTCCKVCNGLFNANLITEADMEYLSTKISREFNIEVKYHKPEENNNEGS